MKPNERVRAYRTHPTPELTIVESTVGCVAQPRTRLDGVYRLRLLSLEKRVRAYDRHPTTRITAIAESHAFGGLYRGLLRFVFLLFTKF